MAWGHVGGPWLGGHVEGRIPAMTKRFADKLVDNLPIIDSAMSLWHVFLEGKGILRFSFVNCLISDRNWPLEDGKRDCRRVSLNTGEERRNLSGYWYIQDCSNASG